MNRARIVVLAIAVGAGGVAAYLASGSGDRPQPAAPQAQLPTVDVLVAKADIGLGQTVTPRRHDLADLADGVGKQYLHPPHRTSRGGHRTHRLDRALALHRRRADPGAETRQGQRLRFMAAILPTGMRAISTEISPETGAGGFILPTTASTSSFRSARRMPRFRIPPTSSGPRSSCRTSASSRSTRRRRKRTARTPWSARPSRSS